MTITRERERSIDFSMPYFETYQSLMVRADSKINDYMALAGKKVGATRGSTGMAMMKIVQPDAVIVPFDGYAPAMKALKNGKIDALATDNIILVGLVAGKEKEFKIVSRFGWDPYGLGFKENNSTLRGRVNEALQAMWDEGEFQEVYDKWLGEDSRYPTDQPFTMTTFPKGNLKP
jgi:polar amino acid transport system substrate-binding protein